MMDAREIRINLFSKGTILPIHLKPTQDDQSFEGELTDASRNGMFIKTSCAFRQGQELDFRLPSEQGDWISGRMQVCWQRVVEESPYLPRGIGGRVLEFFRQTDLKWCKIIENSLGSITLEDLFEPHLLVVNTNDSILVAIKMMTQNRQKVCIVKNRQGKLCGALDFQDIIQALASGEQELLESRVGLFLNPEPHQIAVETGIDEALMLLKNQHKDYILVSKSAKIVGVITLHSVLPYWYEASMLKEERIQANLHRTIDLIAHDMRNPTHIIQSAIDCLDSGILDANEFISEGMCSIIKRNCQLMESLINDLVDSYFKTGSTGELQVKSIDIGELIDNCTTQFARFAINKNIKLTFEYSDQNFIVEADALRLERVLANLISNALKYCSPEDCVTLRLAKVMDPKTHHHWVAIHVQDTGPGIPEHEQGQVFDSYCRISTKPTAGESSTGLGMAISKKIVEAHGGRIELHSQPGLGSTFSVYLPMPG